MSLKGNLQSVDLANVLQMLSINQKEGTLVLFDGDTRKSIYFSQEGVSMLSRGRRGQDSLGRILLRYGRIGEDVLRQALERQRTESRRLGEVLEEMGVVSAADIEDAVRTQIEEEIYNLFIWKEASFEFIEGPPAPTQDAAPARVTFNVNSLIMEAQRRADEWNYIRGLVPSLDEIYKPTDRMPDAVVTDEVFHLPFAPRVLELLQGGRKNVNEVIDASHAAKFEACKILAILLEQGAIEPVTIGDLQAFAQEASAKGDHQQAAKYLSRVVDLGGATPAVNMSLGYALEALDEPERASLYFKAAAESYVEAMEPKHAFDAYQRIARALPTDLAAVSQMVEIACTHDEILGPNRHEVTEAGRVLAACLRELGRLPAAIQILNSLTQANPQDIPLRNMLVQAYQDSGMLNEAMVELEAMADFCAEQKNWDEAIRCLRRVIAIDRNRQGVLKKIEAYTRARDSGKRLVLRIVAAVTAVASLGAIWFGFVYLKDAREKAQEDLRRKVSAELDPLQSDFIDAERAFQKARDALEAWGDSKVFEVERDMADLDHAVGTMEEKLKTTTARAEGLAREHGKDLPESFVDDRVGGLKRRLENVRQAKGTLVDKVTDGAKEQFSRLWATLQVQPIRNTPKVEWILGVLRAVGAGTDVEVDGRSDTVDGILARLKGYATDLEKAQAEADALWDKGKYEESHAVLSEFLGAFFTVTEFSERVRFHVRVTAVPAKAVIRVRTDGAPIDAGPEPQSLRYTAAEGLRFEVSAPGFETKLIRIDPVKGNFNAATLKAQCPSELRVVLTKVPFWIASLGAAGFDAPLVPTPDGKALAGADRSGGVSLLDAAGGKVLASHDTKSVSGFRSSPVVSADSVYAGTADGVLVALDLPGLKLRWRKEGADGPGEMSGAPVLAEGRLVAVGRGGTLVAFDARTGDRQWEVKLGVNVAQPLLFARGWIVVTAEDGVVRAVSPDGTEVKRVLPSGRPEAGYPPPRSKTLVVGERVLLGLEGVGQEFALVELPVRGAADPHVGYKWGAALAGAEVTGACAAGEDLLLLYSTGALSRVSARLGTVSLRGPVVPPKDAPVGAPAFHEGKIFVASRTGIGAYVAGPTGLVENWRWTAPEGVVISTPPAVVGRLVVVGSRDGRVFALLRD
jgi:outer membrane protein assembly factor BamB/tetratricopeptide (TPR) repeat protein